MLLLAQSLRHIALLVSSRLKLREHHIEALHEANFLGLELLELICQAAVSVVDLALHAKVVLVGLGARRQRRIHNVVWVGTIPERSFLT